MQDSKQHEKQVGAAHSNTTCGSPRWGHMLFKGVFIATQLNWTQLTQLNSVQPSQSCFCLWRHDLQTESTVVHAVELSSVELSCVAINGPLDKRHISTVMYWHVLVATLPHRILSPSYLRKYAFSLLHSITWNMRVIVLRESMHFLQRYAPQTIVTFLLQWPWPLTLWPKSCSTTLLLLLVTPLKFWILYSVLFLS